MIRKVILVLCSAIIANAGIIRNDASNYAKIIQSPTIYESVTTTKESKFEGPDGIKHSTFTKSFDTAYSSANKFEAKSSKDLSHPFADTYTSSLPTSIIYHSDPFAASNNPIFSKSVVHTTYAAHDVPVTKNFISPSINNYPTSVVSKTKIINSGVASPSTFYHTQPTLEELSAPITYNTHSVPLTKSILPSTTTSSTSFISPEFSRTKYAAPDLSSYSSYTPIIDAKGIKTSYTYSDAPIVSHMSFSGLGANYAW